MLEKRELEELKQVFTQYRDYFGVGSRDFEIGGFSKDYLERKTMEFEDRFCEIICKYEGHNMSSDKYCHWCGKSQLEINMETK